MSIIHDPRTIAGEVGIVWLDHPSDHAYLREAALEAWGPTGRPKVPPEWRLAAYAITRTRGLQFRRYWWLKRADRPLDPTGPYADPGSAPAEAVLPMSIRAGRPSVPWWPRR